MYLQRGNGYTPIAKADKEAESCFVHRFYASPVPPATSSPTPRPFHSDRAELKPSHGAGGDGGGKGSAGQWRVRVASTLVAGEAMARLARDTGVAAAAGRWLEVIQASLRAEGFATEERVGYVGQGQQVRSVCV